ncbi:MAG: tetraacyldisaccharide 4'-kinase, partial [Burkholderiales bacterium]|nr:tetraacyldisaccharide 4'-kinase [Burkholderiales bacterium]
EALRGRPLCATAGIARPQRFFELLRERGLAITPLPLPDHHAYATLPWPADAADVVVTEKDAIKLQLDRVGGARVWVAPLDFGFDAAFEAALIALLPPPGPRHGNTPA